MRRQSLGVRGRRFLPFPLSWIRPKANGWQPGPRFSPRDEIPSRSARNLTVSAIEIFANYMCA